MKRHPDNPILTRTDIPDLSPTVRDVSSVFNPGAVAAADRTLLLLRVQTRGRETVLMAAESPDGVTFVVRPALVPIDGVDRLDPAPIHVYDPRLTRIEDALYVVAGVDTATGCHLLVASADDALMRLRVVGFDRDREARNGVLFPERIGGRYCRLERPNRTALPSGTRTGDTIWLATSDDLVTWHPERPVLSGRPHFWDERIGSGPPPIKTHEGWLHVYHGVATHLDGAIYQAGVCLLDRDDPSRVIARGRNNVLEPREPWEQIGQVPNVVFPSGMVVDGADAEGCAPPDAPVRIYYGAADTCVGLVQTTVAELLDACRVA